MPESWEKLEKEIPKTKGEPICIHRKAECNGCPLMGIEYRDQLKIKAELVKGLFRKKIRVEPAPSEFFYRNKAELSYIDGKLGFRKREDTRKSFRMSQCWIVGEEMGAAIQKISKRIGELGIESAEIIRRKPGLGYVIVRGNRKGEILCNFVFFGEVQPEIRGLCNELIGEKFTGINIMQNETWSDAGYGTIVETFGKGEIPEEILGRKFMLSGSTFFQTNVASAEKIFAIAKRHVPKKSILLDLYCGVGTIAICVADRCHKVAGLELNEESIRSARQNAAVNGIKNAEFFSGSAGKWLKRAGAWFDTIIIDPPRQGLEQKALFGIRELSPNRIIYISCSPESLARDLKALSGYGIKSIRAFDQFPQTRHIEMLCVLDKKMG